MSRRTALFHYGILVVMGLCWGFTVPLSKIAVSTGFGAYGLVFWQLVIGAALMGAITFARDKPLPLRPGALKVYALIALIGTIIPDGANYTGLAYLPAGVISILLSLVPMLAFPIALALGLERFLWPRFIGLLAGLGGIALLVLPEASLPDPAMLIWVPLALIAPLCYAFESSYVARWGLGGLDPVQVLFGASLIGALVTLPLAIGTGQFISPLRAWAAPEWALVASAVIHVLVYAGYVWLVGRAGAVFAVQVSYLVTGSGVVWAMIILGESYSPYIWAALGLVLVGVFLVQPRRQDTLAPEAPIGETGA